MGQAGQRQRVPARQTKATYLNPYRYFFLPVIELSQAETKKKARLLGRALPSPKRKKGGGDRFSMAAGVVTSPPAERYFNAATKSEAATRAPRRAMPVAGQDARPVR